MFSGTMLAAALAWSIGAAEAPGAAVQWDAPADCPDAQVVVGEIHRQLGQVHRPRHVDRIHTALIGGHVGQDKVHGLAAQRLHQPG